MFACFFMFDAVTDVADSIVLLFLLLPLLSQIRDHGHARYQVQ